MQHKLRWLAVVLMIVGITGAAFAQGGGINVGDTVTETTANANVDYTVSLKAGDSITIDLSSPDFDTYIEVLDASGSVIEFDDDGGDGFNSLLNFTAPSDGTFTIRVRSFSGSADGTYTLVVTGGAAAGGSDFTVTENRTDVAEYPIQLDAEQTVIIDVVSSDFDTYLELYDASGNLLDSDDDGGDGFNSRLTFSAPSAGTYTVRVRSFGSDTAGGEFTLTVASTTIVANASGGALAYNETMTLNPDGAITTSATFDANAGDVINLVINSLGDEDNRLSLVGPDGSVVVEDDDSGEGLNAGLRRFILPATGTYTAEITGYGDSALFQPLEVTLESTVQLSLSEGPQSITLSETVSTDVMTLNTVDEQSYIVTLTLSQEADSSIYLDVEEEGEYFARTRINFAGMSVVSFLYTAQDTGLTQFKFDSYLYGDNEYTVTVEVEEFTGDTGSSNSK